MKEKRAFASYVSAIKEIGKRLTALMLVASMSASYVLPAMATETETEPTKETVADNVVLEGTFVAGHQHTDECYENKLICQIPLTNDHVHTDECAEDQSVLICALPEEGHAHTEDCVGKETVNVCGKEETEGHAHDESCLGETRTLICGKEETAGHTHSDECKGLSDGFVCGLEETAGHTHSDACVTGTEELVCGLEESQGHVHVAECESSHEELICGQEETETHTHTDECKQVTVNYICAQEVSEGHTHGDDCKRITESYTCGQEEAEAHTHSDACREIVNVCGQEEAEAHAHSEECYRTEQTNVCGKEEREAHTHDETCVIEQEVNLCGREESEPHTHGDECYETRKIIICKLPTAEDPAHVHEDACYEKTLICELQEGEQLPITMAGEDGGEEEEETTFTVWIDPSNGGNEFYTKGTTQQTVTGLAEGAKITLPDVDEAGKNGDEDIDAVGSPTDYNYKIRYWYDIATKRAYKPGDEVEVNGNMVFYADWVPVTYNIGEKMGAPHDVEGLDTSDFVRITMYDYNDIANLAGARLKPVEDGSEGEVYSRAYGYDKEIWMDDGLGTNPLTVHTWRDSKDSLEFPENTQQNSASTDVNEDTPGIINTDLFSKGANYYFPATDRGAMGVTKVGEANYLFQYGDDPADANNYGYYYFDSHLNGAAYNQRDGRFYLYDAPSKTTCIDAANRGSQGDFLPYNLAHGHEVVIDHDGTGKHNAQQAELPDANYWYGMKVEINFYLPDTPGAVDENGNNYNKAQGGEDMVFKFKGDDDVWVFVDNKLVLDMGGIHEPVRGEINFATGEAFTKDDVCTEEEPVYPATLPEMEPGNHTITMYYMERGGGMANCGIWFNLMARQSLKIKKADPQDTNADMEGTVFTIYEDAACTQLADELYSDSGLTQPTSTMTINDQHEGTVYGFIWEKPYYFVETTPPDGYYTGNNGILPNRVIKAVFGYDGKLKVEVTPQNSLPGMDGVVFAYVDDDDISDDNHGEFTVFNTKSTTDLYLRKIWYNAEGVREPDKKTSVTVDIYRVISDKADLDNLIDGNLYMEDVEITWDETEQAVFKKLENVDQYDAAGNLYYYYAVEQTIDGYGEPVYLKNGVITGGTITVANAPEGTDIHYHKPTFKLIKEDYSTPANKLSGAEFKLYGYSGNSGTYVQIGSTYTVNEVLELKNVLEYNTAYKLVETKAPEGYSVWEKPYYFGMRHADVEMYPVSVPKNWNNWIPADENDPKTFSHTFKNAKMYIEKEWYDKDGNLIEHPENVKELKGVSAYFDLLETATYTIAPGDLKFSVDLTQWSNSVDSYNDTTVFPNSKANIVIERQGYEQWMNGNTGEVPVIKVNGTAVDAVMNEPDGGYPKTVTYSLELDITEDTVITTSLANGRWSLQKCTITPPANIKEKEPDTTTVLTQVPLNAANEWHYGFDRIKQDGREEHDDVWYDVTYSYQVVENTDNLPEGFSLKGYTNNPVDFKVSDTITIANATGIDTFEPEFTSLEITKLEENTNNKLKDAKFTLSKWNGTEWEPVDSGSTSTSGKLTFENLSYNTAYMLVETDAPDGYEENTNPKYFFFSHADETHYKPMQPDPAPDYETADGKMTISNKKIFVPETTSLSISKVELGKESEKLDGAEFELYVYADGKWSTDPVATKTTNASGTLTFTNLSYNTAYRLVEKTAPEGYELDATEKYYFFPHEDPRYEVSKPANFTYEDVAAGATATITNKKLETTSLTVTKVETGKDSIKLAGASFKLSKWTANGWTEVKTDSTVDGGTLTFSDLSYNVAYKLEETVAPSGYTADSTVRYFFFPKAHDSYPVSQPTENQDPAYKPSEETAVTITNDFVYMFTSLEISKLDATDSSALSGAKFILEKWDGSKWTKANEGITDNDGKLSFSELSFNTAYRLKEDQAPNGFVRDDTYRYFYFTNSDKIHYPEAKPTSEEDPAYANPSGTTEVEIENEFNPEYKSLTVTKVDAVDGATTLQGAAFTLYKWNKDANIWSKVDTGNTDDNGELTFENLSQNVAYKLVEDTAPSGFIKDETVRYYFFANEDDTHYPESKPTGEAFDDIEYSDDDAVKIENEFDVQDTSLTLTKVDAANANIKLDGVVFELYAYTENGWGENPIDTKTTGTNGTLKFEDLSYNVSYKLVETSTKTGYELDSTPRYFIIEKTDDTTHYPVLKDTTVSYENVSENALTITNNKIGVTSLSISKVDEADNSPVNGAEFTLYSWGSEGWSDPRNATSVNGSITFGDLSYNVAYKLVETNAPAGYEKDATERFYIFRKDDTTNYPASEPTEAIRYETVTNGAVTITNKKLETTSLTINKVDAADNSAVDGAKFALYPYVSGGWSTTAFKTGESENGTLIFDGLSYNVAYKLVETDAPAGYEKDATERFYIFRKDDTTNYPASEPTEAIRYETVTNGAVSITNKKLETTSLTINKVDAADNSAVNGAKFALYPYVSGGWSTTAFKTGESENGTLIFDGLSYNVAYKLVETDAPAGYEKDATERFYIFRKDDTINYPASEPETDPGYQEEPRNGVVTITNKKIETTSLTITKVEKDNGENLLDGAEFALYAYVDNAWATEAFQSGTTENGSLTFVGLSYNVAYKLVETKAPAGYALDETERFFFFEKKHESYPVSKPNNVTFEKTENNTITIDNSQKTHSVKIRKVDATTEALLKEATFRLEKWSTKWEQVEIKTTGNGTAEFKNLAWNTVYRLTETVAPSGYILNEEPVYFQIPAPEGAAIDEVILPEDVEEASIQALEAGDDGFEIKVKNTKKGMTSLEILKVDEATEEPLSGAVFELSVWTEEGWDSVKTETSGSNGKLTFGNLSYNTAYKLVEKTAPTGYEKDATARYFFVEHTDEKNYPVTEPENEKLNYEELNDNQAIQITNVKKFVPEKTTLTIQKVEKGNTSNKLKGAKFTLYSWSNGKWTKVSAATTGTNGEASFANLSYNVAYKLEETAAPAGYVKDGGPWYFFFEKDDTEHYPVSKPDSVKTYNTSNKVRITNPEEPTPTMDLKVTKRWYDKEGKETKAPYTVRKVTFKLYRKAEDEKGKTVKLDKKLVGTYDIRKQDKWTVTIRDLPEEGKETVNGKEVSVTYSYYVVENEVKGFYASYKGQYSDKIEIRNSRFAPSPKTGDDSNIMMYLLMLMMSSTGLVTMAARKRRRR